MSSRVGPFALPGETPELKERYGAWIEALEPLETVDAPSLPGAGSARHTLAARPHRALLANREFRAITPRSCCHREDWLKVLDPAEGMASVREICNPKAA